MTKFEDLTNVKSVGYQEKHMFLDERDRLEEKYLNIISEHIKREREHKKEVFKKANAHAIMSSRRNEDEMKKMESEDISDRTPILDILIEKWKYFNKQKKFMIDKYSRNASALKEAFDKMMNYLGVESLDDIPDLLEKVEDQMSNINMFISSLNNESFSLQDKKSFLEKQIKDLISRSSQTTDQKSSFMEHKKDRIDILKKKINDFNIGTTEKEKFFKDLKNPTDRFLLQMEKTFLCDYVPARTHINEEEFYNEENITSRLANVQDYLAIIEEVEKVLNTQNEKEASPTNNNTKEINESNINALINKELDKLKLDMKNKIEMLNASKLNNNYVYSNMKDKINSSFDDTIKKMSKEIVSGNLPEKKKIK